MRAAIEKHMHRAIPVAHHQNGLRADGRPEIIACIGDLAVMTDIDPCIGEQMVHFELEDFLVDIDIAMHLALANQTSDCFDIAFVA